MDGIDGMAAGQATVAGLLWYLLGLFLHQPLLMVLGFLSACTSMGFLAHNWPPARIFMGDVGSAFLGYTFAVLPLMANFPQTGKGGWDASFFVGILINWPFLADTVFTFSRRIYNGEDILRAHRTHIYQRLVNVGYNMTFISLIYMGLSFLGGMLALLWGTSYMKI